MRRAAPRTHSPHSLRVGAKARLPVGNTDVDGADRGAVRAVEGLRGGEQAHAKGSSVSANTHDPISPLSLLTSRSCTAWRRSLNIAYFGAVRVGIPRIRPCHGGAVREKRGEALADFAPLAACARRMACSMLAVSRRPPAF